MRTHGTLTKWNDDRGFGFISPASGSGEIFVHISAFPRDGRRPTLDEVVSYEIETGGDGKARAVKIMRPGGKPDTRIARRTHREREAPSVVEMVIAVLLVGGIAGYAYIRVHRPEVSTAAPQLTDAAKIRASLECENHTMCSQMHSCEEATHYLQTCPNTEMDGDADGIPCEQQWCNADAD